MRLLLICLMYSNLLHAQTNFELLGRLAYDSTSLAGCWHYVDQEENEYALVGTSRGLSIVNVNEPTAPYELFRVPGLINNWREVKTWAGFAYVSTEAPQSGITIVNLNLLPDTIAYKTWFGDSAHQNIVLSAHTVATEDGFLYIFGSKPVANGVIVCDLKDPWNPVVVGTYNQNYIHDGYVRNDTLWAGEIYAGQFSVIPLKDKSNLAAIASQVTPGKFNHNTWLSDDGQTLFTTDERIGAPLTSFRIKDLNDIQQLDTYYPSEFPHLMVHNVRVLKDFLINPSYGGQLTIVDAHRPDNLVEVAFASLGTSLVWDADPYLPSGIVIATAKNEGLFIYRPNYVRACYLEGVVRDSTTKLPLHRATVRLVGTAVMDSTSALGIFKTGFHTPGNWTVEVSCPSYETKTIPLVQLLRGQVAQLDVELAPLPVSVDPIGQDALEILVYPNSFSNTLFLRVQNAPETRPVYLEITDLNGKMMYGTKLVEGKQQIRLVDTWPAGHYILTFKTPQGIVHTQRAVKL